METDKKSKRSKLLYAGVIVILILFFIVGFIYGLSSVLKMEGNFPPAQLQEGISPAPQTKAEAVDYLNKVVKSALSQKPKFSSGAAFDINEDSLETGCAATIKDTLLYVCDGVDDHINKIFETHEADFSEGFDSFLRVPEITESDVENFTCSYIYYKCISCGETSNEPQDFCEPCGSTYPYQMQYRDNYTITYELNVSDSVLNKNFNVRSENDVRAMLGDQLNGVFSIGSINMKPSGLNITLQADRMSDELKSLSFNKTTPVEISGMFEGKCASLGSLDLKVDVTEKEYYNFTWPSIDLSAHSKDIEPKESDNLLATLTFPNPSQANVKWESSDEDIVTVDDEGYFKSGKTVGNATITASYEFNGKTYSDSCEIHVKYDVESLALNKRKVTVNTGDTYTLTAKASPKKATIQTVKWYSDDESIAVVDENGVVTAVAPGVVTVYALSDDLYYKASCEVTVK